MADGQMRSVRDQVSDAEWFQRIQLAAAFRAFAHFGWDDLIFTHLSARVPGPEHHFLMNPYNLTFDEITASSLLKIDVDGNPVMESPYMANPAGFVIHSALHMAREDAKCVMHLHSVSGQAVSAQKQGLLPVCQTSMIGMTNGVAYHDYEGIATDMDERERLVADMGDAHVMILRNHGTLTVGEEIADAFMRMYFLERACQVQIAALAGGSDLIPPPDGTPAKVEEQIKQTMVVGARVLAWPAMYRKMQRLSPGFED